MNALSKALLVAALLNVPAPASGAELAGPLAPEASAPRARGQVAMGVEGLTVKVDGLEPSRSYFVRAAKQGILSIDLGTISTEAQGQGLLRVLFSGGGNIALPPTYDNLAGRTLEVFDGGGAVLRGEIPGPAVLERKEGLTRLLQPEPPVDPDLVGDVKLESRDGRMAIKVHLVGLAPSEVTSVCLIDHAKMEMFLLGTITASAEGKGQMKVDSGRGDAIPFCPRSVGDLTGLSAEIRNAKGDLLLAATLGPVQDAIDGGNPPEPLFGLVGPFDAPFLRGDTNADSKTDISDAVATLQYLFLAGPRPYCLDPGDFDDSGALDITDAIAMLNFLFLAGAPGPYPSVWVPGFDPTADGLHCEE
jgi:hypothetical protein